MNRSLGSDNHSGIHPLILKAICEANVGHSPSYGTDNFTEEVRQIFKNKFGSRSETLFVFNGTAANVLSIKTFLKSYESVICSDVSHIHLDECGAPEAIAGIKLIALPSKNGKITPEQCEQALIRLGDQHFSQPRMISITQPTELGTLYSFEEMQAFSNFCKSRNLFFHVDGARFIHAAHRLNKSFKELSHDIGVDVLSFGGTKNGLLFGECVVLFDSQRAKDLKFYRKQSLQLPSKMRFLSAQFKAFFENDLWRTISSHECDLAQYLANQVSDISEVKILYPVEANAVFAKFPKEWTKPLKKSHFFYIWDETIWSARWMLSFDSTKSDVDNFIQTLHQLKNPTQNKKPPKKGQKK